MENCSDLTKPLLASAHKMPNSSSDLLKIIAASVSAQNVGGEPTSVENLALVAGVAQSLTVPDNAKSALLSALGNNIIFRVDGGVPTATAGHTLLNNQDFSLKRNLLLTLTVISIGSNANFFVTYFK